MTQIITKREKFDEDVMKPLLTDPVSIKMI